MRLGAGRLPSGLSWAQICGTGAVAGIGFTMSLYVAALAFPDPPMLANAKLAILSASLISVLSGLVILHFATRQEAFMAGMSGGPGKRLS